MKLVHVWGGFLCPTDFKLPNVTTKIMNLSTNFEDYVKKRELSIVVCKEIRKAEGIGSEETGEIEDDENVIDMDNMLIILEK